MGVPRAGQAPVVIRLVVSLSPVIELLSPSVWQMTLGERAALEGILAQLKPSLSIEIGTAEGGSLRRIAAHSGEVHSFDLVKPAAPVTQLSNVKLHTGDSHVLLAEYLAELGRASVNVDFALVDGDHTAEGVREDLNALLSSNAVGRCVILIHDTANEIVRDGLERVRYRDYPKIAQLDLDFLAGHLSNQGPFHHQLWGGLGLIVVDSGPDVSRRAELPASQFYSSFEVFSAIRDGLVESEHRGLTASPRDVVDLSGPSEREVVLSRDLKEAHAVLDSITQSVSWRATAPLRDLKRTIKSRVRV